MIKVHLVLLLTTICSSFLVSYFFRKMNIIDKPDGIKKVHKGNISLGGGLALFISISLIFFIFPNYLQNINNYLGSQELIIIWNVSFIILMLGLVDDIKPLPVSMRIIIQVLASWIVIILTDIYIEDLGNLLGVGNFYLGELGIPLTIFMVVGLCNAFNMLDGMDGLVTGVSLVVFAAMAILSFLVNATSPFFLVSFCLLIFMIFNLGLFGKKWKIFLGDSGSMWLGFLIAWLLVGLSQEDERLFTPVAALWLVLLPLIDALSTFLSRIWNKKMIFSGDRTHIHHMLLDSGLKKWKVLIIFLVISISSASLGVYFTKVLINEYYLFYGFLTLWFFYFLLIKYPYSKKIEP